MWSYVSIFVLYHTNRKTGPKPRVSISPTPISNGAQNGVLVFFGNGFVKQSKMLGRNVHEHPPFFFRRGVGIRLQTFARGHQINQMVFKFQRRDAMVPHRFFFSPCVHGLGNGFVLALRNERAPERAQCKILFAGGKNTGVVNRIFNNSGHRCLLKDGKGICVYGRRRQQRTGWIKPAPMWFQTTQYLLRSSGCTKCRPERR